MEIKINIRFEPFNNEYHADINFPDCNVGYYGADDLEELMDLIKKSVLLNRSYQINK